MVKDKVSHMIQQDKKTFGGSEYECSSFWISEKDGDILAFPGKRKKDIRTCYCSKYSASR